MKDLAAKTNVPTAGYARFRDAPAARAYVRDYAAKHPGATIVVKADGLAAGKGVAICQTVAEAVEAIDATMIEKRFGASGTELVIEEFLPGPNTGGMGAYSPAPIMTQALVDTVMRTIIQPTLDGMAALGRPFKGVLFAGLMISDGKPKLLEFNVRFGDPEAQALLPRLKTDLVDICLAVAEGKLERVALKWDPRPAVSVVLASGGYPGTYHTHLPITGLDALAQSKEVLVFQAGTEMSHGQLVTSGGRVLAVTALGTDMADAIERAYEAVEQIHFDGAHFRWDIGAKAL